MGSGVPGKDTAKMRRLLLLSVAVVSVAGCHSILGPRSPQHVDDPLVSTAEQERRGRQQLAIPEDAPSDPLKLTPRTYTDRPGPHGR